MKEPEIGQVVLSATQFGWVFESGGNLEVMLLDGQITTIKGFKVAEPLTEPINLGLLKVSHPLGAIWVRAYANLNKEIQDLIKICRAKGNPMVLKLLEAVETGDYYRISTSNLKQLIPQARFNKLFEIACKSVAFGLEEAQIIESDYRQTLAFDLGLDLDATWQQIEVAQKRKNEDDEFWNKMQEDKAFHDYIYRLQVEFILEIQDCNSLADLESLFRKLVTLDTNDMAVIAIRQVQDRVHPANKVTDTVINAILIIYLELAGNRKNQRIIDILYNKLGK